MEYFKLDVDSDGIALITWDMPGQAMNILTDACCAEISDWLKQVVEDDGVKGAVLTSGKDGFCAGADLGQIEEAAAALTAGGGAPSEDLLRTGFERVFAMNKLFRELETCGKPIAAAVNGVALGGGFELALACHYRVVADNPKVKLGLPEAQVGLMPGAGGTQRLPRLLGFTTALPLILESKNLDPATAAALGAVHKVAPADEVIAEAKAWVKDKGDAVAPWDKKDFKIKDGGPYDGENMQNFAVGNALLHGKSFGNYPSLEYIMRAVYEGLLVDLDTGLRIESRYFLKLLLRPEPRNMIRSLFLSTQELNKGARRPSGQPETDIKKVGILGAGMMGAGIAYVSAMSGLDCILIDVDEAAAQKGRDLSAKLQDKAISRGRSTPEKKDEILARITPATDYGLLKDADLVIEAVFEDRKVKADVTGKAEAVLGKEAVFGSNTSTLPITGLAQASVRPENFIGIHFFSPVDRMPLVEIIMGERTSDHALALALDYVRKIRKTPIVVNDSRGFYTSRCFSTYVQEGMHMLAEGIVPALIENAGKMAGMPVAPLAMADEVSLELGHHIMQQAKEDLGEKFVETPAQKLLEKMVVELGRKGRKNGKGFYDYPEDGSKALWPGLADLAPRAPAQPDVEDLKTRLMYIQALETARCFEEGVLTDVRDADVGAILGWVFAPFTGGPLSFIDTIGARKFVETCDRLTEAYGDRFQPNDLLRDMARKGDSFYSRFKPASRDAA